MICWFCSVREAESKYDMDFEMHSAMNAKKDDSETQVAYNVNEIVIPRCAECNSKHIRVRIISFLALCVLIILLAAVIASLTNLTSVWIWGIGLGLSTAVLVGLLVVRGCELKGIKSVWKAKVGFPEVKLLREKGYKTGRRPKQLSKKFFRSDKPVDEQETEK